MNKIKNLDLWGNVLDDSNNAESVISLLEEQASLLEEKTNGKVKAKFVKIEYAYAGSKIDTIQSFTELVSAINPLISKKTKQEVIDETLNDARYLYKQEDYKFEIFNEKFKYRVFTLKYRSIFPLTILLEPGILDDENDEIKISGQENMERILRKILTSDKIRFIIQQLSKDDANKQ